MPAVKTTNLLDPSGVEPCPFVTGETFRTFSPPHYEVAICFNPTTLRRMKLCKAGDLTITF